jgi:dipeptidyl aminopeptidase/acylaminoacyl peptidase
MKKLEDYKIMPIFAGQPVGDPQVSPDGSKVLFTFSEVNMDEDKYDTHIWLLDLKEKKPRQFTYGKQNTSNPRWSPDGETILFTSSRPSEDETKDEAEEKKKKKAQLYAIPAFGGEARQLTKVEEGAQNPQWSPDGKTVMFISNVFKGEKKKESDVKIIRRIKYKGDGKGFYEGKYAHVFSVPVRGGKAKQLTDGEFDVTSPVWSIDGKTIAFVGNLDEDGDYSYLRYVYTIPAKGGKPKKMFEWQGSVGALGYSPDGKYLAFTGREIKDPGLVWYKKTDLWVIPVKGGEPRNLTTGFDRTVSAGEGALDWSPDSKSVYVKFPNHGTSHIYRVSLEGEVEPLTEGQMNVGSFTLDKSGEVFSYIASDSMTPSELWTLDGDGAKKRTELNNPLLKKLRIIPPEEFWFTASDGTKVQGWIIKPKEFKKGQKYPTCFEIHGGPRGAYGFTLGPAEHEFQVLADHGYVVVYTNPRFSTGYGEKFCSEPSGHWGERDYLDIMEATDYIIETYDYVDPKRIAVLGGSYGGFMTNWIIGHTDRYKTAITMRSISNWYSFHGTSDIGWMSLPTMELNWGKNPWDDLERIMDKSPITYIKNMVTPLLIIHSEHDYRCPMEQGEQLFAGLKKLGRTVEFVRFPDEPHGLSRMGKPKHREERLQHIVRWFDRYL